MGLDLVKSDGSGSNIYLNLDEEIINDIFGGDENCCQLYARAS